LPPWVLLIVDDEQQVHEATTLTLRLMMEVIGNILLGTSKPDGTPS
jgi:hypothetical protein